MATVAPAPPAATAGPRHRTTRRAELLLAILRRSHRPLSAMQLFDTVRVQPHAPSLTTIYRLVHSLAEEGVLHTFRVGDETAYLACVEEPHDHLICTSCGRVQAQPVDALRTWLNQIEADGFVVSVHRAEVYGRCRRCCGAGDTNS